MAVVKELIRAEKDGSISFGDYELASKTKKQDFEYQGDLYKVKTFREITKLERNDLFVYESVPGTAVEHFKVTADSVEFQVEGPEDAQITLGLEDDTEYLTVVDGVSAGAITTGLGGKLVLSCLLYTSGYRGRKCKYGRHLLLSGYDRLAVAVYRAAVSGSGTAYF